jgi:hypothetical protein
MIIRVTLVAIVVAFIGCAILAFLDPDVEGSLFPSLTKYPALAALPAPSSENAFNRECGQDTNERRFAVKTPKINDFDQLNRSNPILVFSNPGQTIGPICNIVSGADAALTGAVGAADMAGHEFPEIYYAGENGERERGYIEKEDKIRLIEAQKYYSNVANGLRAVAARNEADFVSRESPGIGNNMFAKTKGPENLRSNRPDSPSVIIEVLPEGTVVHVDKCDKTMQFCLTSVQTLKGRRSGLLPRNSLDPANPPDDATDGKQATVPEGIVGRYGSLGPSGALK